MSIYKIRTEFAHQLKWLMALLAIIFIVGAFFTFGSAPRGGNQSNGASDVVATVNGLEITRGEMEAQWEQMLDQYRSQPGAQRSTMALARLRAQVLQGLIGTRISAVTADKMGVSVSPSDVAAERDKIMLQALRDSRRKTLGKLTPEQEKIDPRQDAEYKSELAKSVGPDGLPMSIDQVEKSIARYLPEAQIQQQLAMKGIQRALEAKIGTVTPQDVSNSFNEYKYRFIMFDKSMPQSQLATQVNKVDQEAKGGGDFAKLAQTYSKDPTKGAIGTAQFGMVSPSVWDTLVKMKKGDVSNPIDAGQQIYIVKIEDVVQKLPANFDKKAQDDRKKMIQQMRMGQEYSKFQDELKKDLQVKVIDPELNGYYLISQAMQGGTPQEQMAKMKDAQKAFETALGKQPNNAYIQAILADLFRSQGNTDKAIQLLSQMFAGNGYGADLRVTLGDMLLSKGKKADAVDQYTKASQEAGMDVEMHKQLATKFKAVGKPDLAAKETATAADFEAKMKILQARQNANSPKPAVP